MEAGPGGGDWAEWAAESGAAWGEQFEDSEAAWVEEPEILRFFYGRLEPIGGWVTDLVDAFRRDLGDSL